jgi:hypothetical protein
MRSGQHQANTCSAFCCCHFHLIVWISLLMNWLMWDVWGLIAECMTRTGRYEWRNVCRLLLYDPRIVWSRRIPMVYESLLMRQWMTLGTLDSSHWSLMTDNQHLNNMYSWWMEGGREGETELSVNFLYCYLYICVIVFVFVSLINQWYSRNYN